jgi:peptidoglycan-associated lipoprotein
VSEEPPPAEPTGEEQGQSGTEMEGLREDEMGEFRELDDPESELAERVIYFDFDQDTVKDEYRDLVRSHAEYLRERPDLEVRLEGHTDERGSREYNIGLGDRRARAVRQMLVLYGVSEDQIRTVSYGEERPAVDESNESAWAENRRVEIVYIR